MTSAPLLDIFGKNSQLPRGGSVQFQTPYGTAGVRDAGQPQSDQPPHFIGGSPNLGIPQDNATPPAAVPPAVAPAAGLPVSPSPIQPAAQNATQRWQAGAADRYAARKDARNAMNSTRNPQTRDFFRQQLRIRPGSGNIPGFGTPASPPVGLNGSGSAQPPVGLGTSRAAGYGGGRPLFFENSDSFWQPY